MSMLPARWFQALSRCAAPAAPRRFHPDWEDTVFAELADDEAAADAQRSGACGWFDSSLELRQGLAVAECSLEDWTAAEWAAAVQCRSAAQAAQAARRALT
ncbi:MAG: hypothetical protein KBC73_21680 [Burkholderiaceae bacterium]|nr:hypothetical protein [Burkholderiaceae bacterium]